MEEAYVVYVFAKSTEEGLTAPVKIGISKSASSRLATIRTSCPFKIDRAYEFECPNREIAEYLERMFHETQESHRLHGEWFDYPPLVAIHLLCLGYRVMLDATCSDKSLHEPLLDCAGVLWAETRFGLGVPPEALQ